MELGSTRCTRDVGDLNTILKWLAQHNPFDIQRPELRSLSSGLTASDGDGVNCDEVEEVVFLLQGKLDDVKYHEASMKRTEKVPTLIHLTKGIKIDQETVHVEPLILFSRLLVLLERCEDTTPYFQYELTPFPSSLLKRSFMLKPNKSVLGTSLTSGVTTVTTEIDTSYVLDVLGRCFTGSDGWLETLTKTSPCSTCRMSVIDMEHVASFSTAIQVDPH